MERMRTFNRNKLLIVVLCIAVLVLSIAAGIIGQNATTVLAAATDPQTQHQRVFGEDHLRSNPLRIYDNSIIATGNYYLTQDLELAATQTIEGHVHICLNGYSIRMADSAVSGGPFFVGTAGATLNLYDDVWHEDTAPDHAKHYYNIVDDVYDFSNASAGASDGYILGGVVIGGADVVGYDPDVTSPYAGALGSAVTVYGGGFFNMYGGTISGSKSNQAAVYSGGSLSEAGANQNVAMYGGSIKGNLGGIMAITGMVEIWNGEISNNNTSGITIFDAELLLNGGSIRNNEMYGIIFLDSVAAGEGKEGNSVFKISGNPKVENHTWANVGFLDGVVVPVLSGPLTEGARIGINPGDFDSITVLGVDGGKGFSYYHPGENPNKYFFADAAGKDHEFSLAEDGSVTLGKHIHDGDEYKALPANYTGGPLAAGNYYLQGNYELAAQMQITSGTVNLCLNGYRMALSGGRQGVLVAVTDNGNFNLCDEDWTTRTVDNDRIHNYTVSNYGSYLFGSGTSYVTGGVLSGGVEIGSAHFTLNGGTISGNSGSTRAVSVAGDGASFVMNGGSIKGNYAEGRSVVNIAAGSFALNGGEIVNNVSTVGAVTPGNNFSVSGAPVVANNTTSGGAAANVVLSEGQLINVSAPLTDGANICVTTDSDRIFTKGLGGKGSASAFQSDNTNWQVWAFTTGEAAVAWFVDENLIFVPLEQTSGDLAAGNYYLKDDIDVTLLCMRDGVYNLHLNGHKLTGFKSGNNIASPINIYATLNLYDNDENSGIITTDVDNAASGVYVYGGTFNMYGGTISGNIAQEEGGGGVVLYINATFNMYGGIISGNIAKNDGGGVCVYDSTFNMHDGQIINNSAVGDGGGVCVYALNTDATFVMHNGIIAGNSARDGGGVCVYTKTAGATAMFNMNGGKIDNNTATQRGGGVMVFGYGQITATVVFNMQNGEITNNNAQTHGGGVYILSGTINEPIASMIMSGGKIADNTTVGYGGGIGSYRGNFEMKDGEITGNSSNLGGGAVYFEQNDPDSSATFTMSGGSITNNVSERNLGDSVLSGGAVASRTSNANGIKGGTLTVTISGSAYIYGNTFADGTAGNLDLTGKVNNGYAEIAGVFTEGAMIGVTVAGDVQSITSNDFASVCGDDFSMFVADNDSYEITLQDNQVTFVQHTHESVVFRPLDESYTGGILPAGNYFLTKDIVVTQEMTVLSSDDVHLCLNGHRLIFDASLGFAGDYGIAISGTLSIHDCGDEQRMFGQPSATNGYVEGGNETTVTGGIISVTADFLRDRPILINIDSNGGTSTGGVFRLYGGLITLTGATNYASPCLVNVNANATFEMHGGKLHAFGTSLAAVVSYGTVNVYNGEIGGSGAVVQLRGSTTDANVLTVTGGKIGAVLADSYAGILVYQGNVSLSGNAAVSAIYFEHPNSMLILVNTFEVPVSPIKIALDSERVFTQGFAASCSGSVADYFVAVDTDLNLDWVQGGEVAIGHIHDNRLYTDLNSIATESADLSLDSGSYYLSKSLLLNNLTVNGDVWICLGDGVTLEVSNITVTAGNLDIAMHTDTIFGTIKSNGLTTINNSKLSVAQGISMIMLGDIDLTSSSFDLHGAITTDNAAAISVCVYANSTFTMYDGSSISGLGYSAVRVEDGGVFIMNGGTISNNSNTEEYGGAVHIKSGGTFTMYNGILSGNSAQYGGAVYAYGGTFTMHDGTIDSNSTTTRYGGGVYLEASSTFTMYGGTISNNTASRGGAVNTNSSTFNLEGGIIDGNYASGNGGAINTERYSEVNISSGQIINNTSGSNGGAICVFGHSTINLSGGTFSNNKSNGNRDQDIYWYYDGTVNIQGDVGKIIAHIYNNKYLTATGQITGSTKITLTTTSRIWVKDYGKYNNDAPALYFQNSDNTTLLTMDGYDVVSATHMHDGERFDSIFDTTGGELTTGNYYLTRDVQITSTLRIPADNTVRICLNGYTLLLCNSGVGIRVSGTLYIYDENTGTKHYYHNNGGVYDFNTATADNNHGYFEGGIISFDEGRLIGGHEASMIYLDTDNASLYLNGGMLVGNNTKGPAVGISGAQSKFEMSGGSIIGSTNAVKYIDATGGYSDFIMTGGTITNNQKGVTADNSLIVKILGGSIDGNVEYDLYLPGETVLEFTTAPASDMYIGVLAVDRDRSERLVTVGLNNRASLQQNIGRAIVVGGEELHFGMVDDEGAVGTHYYDGMLFLPLDDIMKLTVSPGNWYLTSNNVADTFINMPAKGTFNLNLNGYTVTYSAGGTFIRGPQTGTTTATLNIYDYHDRIEGISKHYYTVGEDGVYQWYGVTAETSGAQYVESGAIMFNKTAAHALHIYSGLTVNLYGGSIISGASGIAVDKGETFNMYGGAIYAQNTGVNFYADSSTGATGYVFGMYGGKIVGCSIGVNFAYEGTMTVSGDVSISDNKQNVVLASSETIVVDGILADSALIGVTKEGGGLVVQNYSETIAAHFVADDDLYIIGQGVSNNNAIALQYKNYWTTAYSRGGWTYNSDASTETTPVALYGNVQIEYFTDETLTISYNGAFDATTPAGTYYAKVTVAAMDTYQGLEQVYSFTVSKATITPVVTVDNWTYNAQASTPSISGNAGEGNITYLYTGTTNGGVSYSSNVAPTEAGNYTLTITIAETDNYLSGTAACNFAINRATYVPTVSIIGWTYGDVANAPTLSVHYEEGAITFSYRAASDNSSSVADVPVNAGNYFVSVSIAQTNNYTETSAETAFTISKRKLTVTANDVTVTHGDDAPSYTVSYEGFVSGEDSNNLVGTLSFHCSYLTSSKVGKYTITPSGYTSDNYDIVYSVGYVNVLAKTITIIWSGADITYDGADHTSTITAMYIDNAKNEVFLTVTTPHGFRDYVEGGHVFTASFANGESDYALPEDPTATYHINKRVVKASADDKSMIYGDSLPALTWQYTTGSDSFVETDGIEVLIFTDANSETDIGKYPIAFSVGSSARLANYDIQLTGATLTINTRSIVVTIASTSSVYGSERAVLSASVTGGTIVNNDDVYSLSCDVNTLSTVGSYNIVGTRTNDNYSVSFFGGADAYAVLPANITNVLVTGISGMQYNGSDRDVVLSKSATTVNNQVATWTFSLMQNGVYVPTLTVRDASNSTVYYKITADNHNEYSGSFGYSIVQATNSWSSQLAISGWTYGDTANSPIAAAQYGSVAISYSDTENGQYSPTVPTQAGTYWVRAYVEETSNYTTLVSKVSFVIAKRDITITIDDKASVYGDNLVTLTASITEGTLASNDSYSGLNVVLTKGPGTDAAKYAITGAYTNANYNVKFVNGEYTINAKEVSVTWSGHTATFVYDGTDQLYKIKAYFVGTSGRVDLDVSADPETFIVAGTYTLTVTSSDANYKLTNTEISVTMNKQGVDAPQINGKTYNGSAMSADVPESELYRVHQNEKHTNKGTYDVVLKLNDYDNYQWNNRDGITVNGETVTLKFVIYADDNSWSIQPSIESITFGDTLVVKGQSSYGQVKVQYRLASGGNYSEQQPTNAGSYTAVFSVEGTSDYSSLSTTVEFSINQKAATVVWEKDDSYTYNGTDQSSSITAYFMDIKAAKVTANIQFVKDYETTFKDAGTYTLTAQFADAGNYQLSDTVISVTIDQLTVSIKADNAEMEYGDTVPTLSWIYTSDVQFVADDNINFGVTTNATSASDASTYAITITTQDLANYNVIYAEGTLTINPRNITVTIDNKSSYYGDPIVELTSSVTSGNIVNSDTNVYTLECGVSSTSDVDSYNITGATSNGNYNINFVAGQYQINPRAITDVKVTPYGDTYDGQPHDVAVFMDAVTANEQVAVWSFSVNGKPYTGQLQLTDAGTYEVSYEITADNHQTYEGIFNVTIGKATYDMTGVRFAQSHYAYVYNGQSQAPSLTGALPIGHDGIRVQAIPGTALTNVSEGMKAYFVAFTTDSDNYYAPASMSVTVQITAKPVVVAWAGLDDLVYNGQDQSSAISARYVDVAGNEVGATSIAFVANDQDASLINAGYYSAVASFADDRNYQVTGTTHAVTMGQRVVSVQSDSQTMTYGEDKPAFTWSYVTSSEYFVDADQIKVTANVNVDKPDATTYDIAIVCEGDALGNYDIKLQIGKLTVSQRALKVAIDNKTSVFGEEIALLTSQITEGSIVEGDNDVYELVCSVTSASPRGNYSITGNTLNSNYTIVFEAGTYYVSDTLLTNVSVTGYNSTYDGHYHDVAIAKSATPVGDVEVSWTFCLSKDGVYLSQLQLMDAGKYTVHYKASAANHETATGTFEVNIGKANYVMTAVTFSDVELVYNGLLQHPVIVGDLPSGVAVDEYLGGATNVADGRQPVTVTFVSTDNNYNAPASMTAYVQITHATATVVWTNNESYVYTSGDQSNTISAQLFGENGETFDASIAFEKDGQAAGFIDAGTYTVKASFEGAGNYQINNETKQIAIAQATNEWLVEAAIEGWIYGEDKQPVGSALFGEVVFEYYLNGEKQNSKPSAGGNYTMSAKVVATDNFTALESGTISFTIERAIVDVPTVESKTYTGRTLYAEVFNNSVYETVTNDGGTDVGEYPVTIRLTNSNNYRWRTTDEASVTVMFVITKAGNSITGLTIDNWAYGTPNATPTAKSEFGTIVYDYSTEENGVYSPIVPTDAGNYWVRASVAETTNFAGAEAKAQFEIFVADHNAITSLTLEGWTYGEEPNAPSATAVVGRIVYSYSTTQYGDYLPTVPTDAGTYWVKATVEETASYPGAEAVVSFVIAQRDITITIDDKASVYGDDLVGLTASITEGTLASNDTYDGLDVVLTKDPGADAGKYPIEGAYTNANYNVKFVNGEYTINAKEVSVTWSGHTATFVYDGKDQSDTITAYYTDIEGKQINANIQFSIENSAVAFKNAGIYTLTAEFDSTDNYQLSDTVISVTIDQLTVSIKADNAEMEYGDTVPTLSWSYTGDVQFVAADNISFGVTTVATSMSNANTYAITITTQDLANYNVSYEEGTLTINPRNITVTIDNKSTAYGDPIVELTSSVTSGEIVNGDTNVYKLVCNVQELSGIGSYPITVVTLNNNYNITYTAGEYVVASYKITNVTVNPYSGTYDGLPHNVAVSMDAVIMDGETAVWSFSVNGNPYTEQLQLTDAGTYEVSYRITANNHQTYEGKFTVTIGKATYDMTGISFEGKTVVENGGIHSLAITGNLPGGVTVEYRQNDKSEPGVYQVEAVFTGNANYNSIAPMIATLTIKAKEIVTNDNDVKIESEEGINPEYQLEVKDATEESSSLQLPKDQTIVQAFDITLQYEGQAVQPDGTITIRLLIAEENRAESKLKVYYVGADGVLTDMDAMRDGEYMVFETDHLSRYIIVADASVNNVGLIVGLVVGGILLAGIVVALVLVIKKKKNSVK